MWPSTETTLLLFVALLNAYTAYMSRQNRKTINLLEKNTNSIKDALVASTDRAAHAIGKAEGIAIGTAQGEAKTASSL